MARALAVLTRRSVTLPRTDSNNWHDCILCIRLVTTNELHNLRILQHFAISLLQGALYRLLIWSLGMKYVHMGVTMYDDEGQG